MSEVTIIFSDDDKKNLEKYMEMTRGGKWNIHDDFDIRDIMQVVLNDIDKKVNRTRGAIKAPLNILIQLFCRHLRELVYQLQHILLNCQCILVCNAVAGRFAVCILLALFSDMILITACFAEFARICK